MGNTEAPLEGVREERLISDDLTRRQKLLGFPCSRQSCRKEYNSEAMWRFLVFCFGAPYWFYIPAVVVVNGYGTGWAPVPIVVATLASIVLQHFILRYAWSTPNKELADDQFHKASAGVFMIAVFANMCLEYSLYVPWGSRLVALLHLSLASLLAMCTSSINMLPIDTTTSMRAWYIVKNSLNLLDSSSDQGSSLMIIGAHWLEWKSWEFYCGWLMMAASLADGAIATVMMVNPLEPSRRLDALSSLLEVPILLIAGAVFITETRLSAQEIAFLVLSCIITVFTVAFKVALCTGIISEEALMQATKRVSAIAVSNARALITTASTVSRVARSRVHPSRDSTEVPRPYSSDFAGVLVPTPVR